jgi:hypothetical protein
MATIQAVDFERAALVSETNHWLCNVSGECDCAAIHWELRVKALGVLVASLFIASSASAQDGLTDAQLCYSGRFDRCAVAGDAYHEGTGVPVSFEMAAELFRYGCASGDMSSCRAMGWIYQHGHGVQASATESHRHYRMACEGGHALACFDVGVIHWSGRGVPVDWPLGQSYYERACSMGHAEGCREMAFIHGRGMGVPRNLWRMAGYLRQACELGSTAACYEMGDPLAAAGVAGEELGAPPRVGVPSSYFEALLVRFRGDPRAAAQLSLARDLAMGGVRFTCEQVVSILRVLGDDSTRVQTVLAIWPGVIDPEHATRIFDVLDHDGNRTLLRQHLRLEDRIGGLGHQR